MPTGYTCIIEDGTPTFRDYALRCARGMMPCIMQRDESLSNPPRLQEPSDYHAKEAEKARVRLAELATYDAADCDHAARTEHARAMGYWQKAVDANAANAAKYEAMRASVLAWKAPTPEHEALRAFMLGQIEISTEHSGVCDPPALRTGAQWLADEMARAGRQYKSAVDSHTEEVARTNSRNAWITALLASLPEEG